MKLDPTGIEIWRGVLAPAAVLVATACLPTTALAVGCSVSALNALGIANLKVTAATPEGKAPSTPRYCYVKGLVVTHGEGAGPNKAGFELHLPAHWNGMYVFGGSRGEGGNFKSSASPRDRAKLLAQGYASVTTDGGHRFSDHKWDYTEPGRPNMPKLVDFFYRAVHQVTVATKGLVVAYYRARRISESYFDGCSNGGREAMIEAARYPADYNGIIAGSPWLDPVGNAFSDIKNVKAFLRTPIPLAKFRAIDAAVLARCDGLDGVRDGLLQNPAACSFDPRSLVPGVLTAAQAEALRTYLSPVRDTAGSLVYPGMTISNLQLQFGSPRQPLVESPTPASDPAGAQPWGMRAATAPFGVGPVPHLWRSGGGVILVLGYRGVRVNLNSSIEGPDGVVKPQVLRTLYRRLRPDIADDPASLRKFFARGGKLIIYHGLSDSIINPYETVWFYKDLASEAGGYAAAQRHARLFLVPGMQHCSDFSKPVRFDTLTALNQWLTRGIGPDGIPSTYTDNGKPVRSLPLCAFPEMARYDGKGSVTVANNWTCEPGNRSMLEVGVDGALAGLNRRSLQTTLVKGTPGIIP